MQLSSWRGSVRTRAHRKFEMAGMQGVGYPGSQESWVTEVQRVKEGKMLVLSRRVGERVVIGDGITVTVTRVAGQRVMLGIEAPDGVRILRGELARRGESHVASAVAQVSAADQVSTGTHVAEAPSTGVAAADGTALDALDASHVPDGLPVPVANVASPLALALTS